MTHHHEAFANLRKTLTDLYPEEDRARIVAQDAGLNTQQITFSGSALNTWNSILQEAENANQIDALLRVVGSEYGANRALTASIDAYRRSTGSPGGASNASPAPVPPAPPTPQVDGEAAEQPAPLPVTERASLPPWFSAAGVVFGALTFLFFIGLAIAGLFGYTVPCDTRFSVVVVLALGTALAASFLGGSAAANGQLPFPFGQASPIQFSIGGGIAVLFIVLLLGYWTYLRSSCAAGTTPVAPGAAATTAPSEQQPSSEPPTIAPTVAPTSTVLPTTSAENVAPKFTSDVVFDPQWIAQVEYATESGMLPTETITDFLQLTRIALGELDTRERAYNVQLKLKNTGSRPLRLDLSQRFFSFEDDQGRKAELVYFCCDANGDLLSPGQSRTMQIMFLEDPGWNGKETSAGSLFFRVNGLLPVVRAAWQIPVLGMAE